ncbi:hypothetical protein [Acrocarpospora sp. B8E8]|uniref:hypothetical protein n=1 Tax=Acrocarpospora sp. B8E8 TaxID=3153572 RepID=UPI00325DD403
MRAASGHDGGPGGRAGCGERDQGERPGVDLAGGPEGSSARGRLGSDVGGDAPEDPALAAYIRLVVDACPVLSDEQAERLAALLGYR